MVFGRALLRQSIEQKTKGPILWYDESLVDYGSFAEAVKHEEDEIIFSFEVNLGKPAKKVGQDRWAYMDFFQEDNNLFYSECELTISVVIAETAGGKETYTKKISLSFHENTCEIIYLDQNNVDKIIVNGKTFESSEDTKLIARQGEFLTSFQQLMRRKMKRDDGRGRTAWYPVRNSLIFSLHREVSNRVHGKTGSDTIRRISGRLLLGNDEEMLKRMASMGGATNTWKSSIKRLSAQGPIFLNLKNAIIASKLEEIVGLADRNISKYFRDIKYVAPVRATAQRYYRRQELSVSEIDRSGGNVAMFLDSLTPTEKERFNSWMKEHFDVVISATRSGGHIALELSKSGEGRGTNLADIGFGYSQILPIAVQIWSATLRTRVPRHGLRRNQATCLVIEQPELHLHPEYQARIADILSTCINKEEGEGVSVIAETHSQHLVNRLGQLILEEKISKDNVQVIIFDDKEEGGVRFSEFDDNGVLQNWPFGFFEPNYSN